MAREYVQEHCSAFAILERKVGDNELSHAEPTYISTSSTLRSLGHDNSAEVPEATVEYEQDQINELPPPQHPRLEPPISEGVGLYGESKYVTFSFTERNKINELPESIRSGIKNSKLWKEEQERGGLSVTNCLPLYLPEKHKRDAFLVVRMGFDDTINLSNILGLGEPSSFKEGEDGA